MFERWLGHLQRGARGRLLLLPSISGREEKHQLFGIIFSQGWTAPHRNGGKEETCMAKPEPTLSLPSWGLCPPGGSAPSHHDCPFTLSESFRRVLFLTTTGFLGPSSASPGHFEMHCIPSRVLVSAPPQASGAETHCSGAWEGASPDGGAIIPVGTPC